jgi:hypothetical protein
MSLVVERESVAGTLGRGLLVAAGLALLSWVFETEQLLAGGGPFGVAPVTSRLALVSLLVGLGVSLASRLPVASSEPRSLPGILGAALLRGALSALLLALDHLSARLVWQLAVPAVWIGLAAALPAFVEGLARGRSRSWRRDLVAALAVTLVALVAILLAQVQNEYTLAVMEHASLAAALRDVSLALRGTAQHPRLFLELWALPAVPIAACSLGSLRGLGPRASALVVPAATCLAILPTMDLAGIGRPFPVERFIDFPTFSCLVPSYEAFQVSLTLPLAALLARWGSSRLGRREDAPVRAPAAGATAARF